MSPKILSDHLSDEWEKEEIEKVVHLHEQNREFYHIQLVCYDLPGKEHTKEYYLEKIKNLFINCTHPQGE